MLPAWVMALTKMIKAFAEKNEPCKQEKCWLVCNEVSSATDNRVGKMIGNARVFMDDKQCRLR